MDTHVRPVGGRTWSADSAQKERAPHICGLHGRRSATDGHRSDRQRGVSCSHRACRQCPSGRAMSRAAASLRRAGHRSGDDLTAHQLSPAERADRGKAARTAVPRDQQAYYDPPGGDRPDPVELLERQAATRSPSSSRSAMAGCDSPFAFFRGAACQAADLAARPRGFDRPVCAATRTCRTSASSPRPSGSWCSTSTTSTRP